MSLTQQVLDFTRRTGRYPNKKLGQNFLDKHVLGNDDVDLLDGVGTAYISGALMSGHPPVYS